MLSECECVCACVGVCVGGVGNRAQRAVMRLLVLFINTHNIVHSLPHIVYDENIVYIAGGKRSTLCAQELGQECVHIGQDEGGGAVWWQQARVRFKKWLFP